MVSYDPNLSDATNPLATATAYARRGWAPIAVPHRKKGPTVQGWQHLRLSEEQLPHYFNGQPMNVGVLLGEPSGGLVDIDLDAPEASRIASRILPKTGCIFGRAGKPDSHWLYRCEPLVSTAKFQDAKRDDGRPVMLVELRSTGCQTVFPGSTHESGEPITFRTDGDPALIEGPYLLAKVAKLAAACIIARHWPSEGGRHEAALALSGGLARASWDAEDVVQFVGLVADAAGDPEVEDRKRAARDTCEKPADAKTTGWNRLGEIIDNRVVRKATEWLGVRETPAAPAADPLRTEYATELGNAQELVRRHGRDLRYDCDSGSWLVWDGRCWAEDRAGQAAQWSKAVARETWTRLQHLGSALAQKHASRMETAAGVRGVLTLAESEPNIPVRRTELDADPFIFNCRNATIDLRTGKARPHERADLCTRVAPVDYDPAATAPLWTKFLDRIMDGNAKLIAYLQRLAGLALTADATVHELAILFGTGANGKSVFADTIVGLLGNYAAVAPDSLLIQRHHQEHPTEVADLCGRRLVVASENERGGRLRIQLVKKLTGDATLKARFMRQDFFEFPRTHKLWMLTNHKPRIDEDTEAVWRRIRLIPFSITIPPGERDPHLLEKLALERPGILNWAIAGCIDWQRRGMDPPPEVLAATTDYRGEADQLADFFQERLIVGSFARVTRNDLFAAYREFADKAGDRHPMDRTDLFERARRIEGVTDSAWKVGGIVHRGFLGIGLVAPAQEGGAP